MEIQKIWERTLFNSSQFLLSKGKIEINTDSFRVLVEDILEEYNKSRPYDEHFYINTQSVNFSMPAHLKLKRVPDWLAEVVPVRTYLNGIASIGLNYNQRSDSELIIATQYPYVYQKPILTVPLVGQHKVNAVWKHTIDEMTDEITGKTTYELQTITLEDTWFFKLLKARFMQGIGRSRRAFTISDITITTDADAMVSDGEALEEKTMEDLHFNKKISLGVG